MDQLTACQSIEGSGLERTHFFPRQLITPDDLTQNQIYFREKMRRHNRLMHGWGVSCGARVRAGDGDCEIIIEPGYILGPYGDEIVIDREVTVDLCHEGLDGNSVSPCGDVLDPWCSNVRVNRQAGQTLYVAVRYAECQSRPVRVQANGCGCDETECEYSRIRDSFAIKVLTSLPTTYSDPMPEPSGDDLVRCTVSADGEVQAPLCPECPTEPWVILADVVLGDDGSLANIDCFAHRRYVVSFADFYYLCRPARQPGGERPDTLVDRIAEEAGLTTATALVSAIRPDGSRVYIPAYFTVQEGEPMTSFLAREGNREFYDPTTDETFTLAELYALAGADLQELLRNPADALAPLEGVTLRVNRLRSARLELAEHLDQTGLNQLERTHAGSPRAAVMLPANAIKGVGSRSAFGRKLADMTIADVGNTSRETFVTQALEGVSRTRDRRRIEAQANETWTIARDIVELSNGWDVG